MTQTVVYDLDGQKRAYARWAPYYDAVYHRLLGDAHRCTAEEAARDGAVDILEIGVGTGLVLAYYPAQCRVTGIDLSAPMLQKAVEKRATSKAKVGVLAAMDACRLGFADASFDAVTVPFVLTLVPDPEAALDEIMRVLKPGGSIIVTSKFGAEGGLQAKIEEWLAPAMKKVGWSSAFKIERVANWAQARGDVALEDIRKVFPAGYFKLLRLRKAR